MAKNQPIWNVSKFHNHGHHSQVLGFHHVKFEEIPLDDFWNLMWYILAIMKTYIFSNTKMTKNLPNYKFAKFWNMGIIPWFYAIIMWSLRYFEWMASELWCGTCRHEWKKGVFSNTKYARNCLKFLLISKRQASFTGPRPCTCQIWWIWLDSYEIWHGTKGQTGGQTDGWDRFQYHHMVTRVKFG